MVMVGGNLAARRGPNAPYTAPEQYAVTEYILVFTACLQLPKHSAFKRVSEVLLLVAIVFDTVSPGSCPHPSVR